MARLKPWQSVLLLAVMAFGLVYGIYRYRHRFVQSDAGMVALLPEGDLTTFFIDLGKLRASSVLGLLAGSKAAEDPEYRKFVRETGFDYTKDIDAIAGALDEQQIFFVVRGHFVWSKLRDYVSGHGGTCRGDLCDIATSKPERWASFFPIQSNVMALAISRNKSAAYALSPRQNTAPASIPPQPVWVKVSHRLLENPTSLPTGARIFAISLEPASRVVFSIDAPENSRAVFDIRLDAECPTKAKTQIVYGQLTLETKMLKTELARQHQKTSPADLTGLFADGTFRIEGNRVVGMWPVYRELLNALQ